MKIHSILINLVYKIIFVKQLMAVLVPLRCYCDRILVVDGQLLPHLDGLDGDDGDHRTKPWMVQSAPPCVGCEGMVCFMSQGSTVLVKPEWRISMLWVEIFHFLTFSCPLEHPGLVLC